MKRYPHIAARIFNTPLLIHPGKLDAIIAGLGGRLVGADVDLANPSADIGMFSTRRGERNAERGYRVTEGVAVVNIGGALVHKSRFDADSNLLLGYNDIAADIEHALDNTDVHALLLAFDSPGGEVQGAFELSERIYEARGRKPIYAMSDGLAASAAYLAASAADEVIVSKTGYVGSIGVVMRHIDWSAQLASDGVKVTQIYAGAHKIDGNPFEPLPESVKSDLQAEINSLYGMFVEAVAASRNLSPDAVRKTQAQIYRGATAMAAQLADRIGTTDQILSEMAALRARSHPVGQPARATHVSTGETVMTDTTQVAGTGTQPATFTQADIDAAQARGVQSERDRVSGILAHPRAAEQTAIAHQCISSGLTVDQAGAVLGAAPKPATLESVEVGGFAAAMAGIGNPDVSGIEAKHTGPDDPTVLVAGWDRAFGTH